MSVEVIDWGDFYASTFPRHLYRVVGHGYLVVYAVLRGEG